MRIYCDQTRGMFARDFPENLRFLEVKFQSFRLALDLPVDLRGAYVKLHVALKAFQLIVDGDMHRLRISRLP